jgi:hypothetical protein
MRGRIQEFRSCRSSGVRELQSNNRNTAVEFFIARMQQAFSTGRFHSATPELL